MPATKIPRIDSSPSQLVITLPASPQMISRESCGAAPGATALCQSRNRRISGRPTRKQLARNSTAAPVDFATDTTENVPLTCRLVVMPTRIQATTSSIMAAPRLIWPTFSRSMSLSRRIIASGGSAEIDIDTARNRLSTSRSFGWTSIVAGRYWPSRKPPTIGTSRPPVETMTQAAAFRRKRSSLTSKPASIRNRSRPTHVIAASMSAWLCSGRKTASCRPGNQCPRTDGPSNMPPKMLPIRAGCRQRRINSPPTWAKASNTTTWRRKAATSSGDRVLMACTKLRFLEERLPER